MTDRKLRAIAAVPYVLAVGIGLFLTVASQEFGWSGASTFTVACALAALLALLGTPLAMIRSWLPQVASTRRPVRVSSRSLTANELVQFLSLRAAYVDEDLAVAVRGLQVRAENVATTQAQRSAAGVIDAVADLYVANTMTDAIRRSRTSHASATVELNGTEVAWPCSAEPMVLQLSRDDESNVGRNVRPPRVLAAN